MKLNPIDHLLTRLDKVKELKSTAKGTQYKALCPSHADKTPSLIITECSNGTVLVKCWAGCTTNEVVSALGLTLKDLFPNKDNAYTSRPKQPSKQAIAHESFIVDIAKTSLTKGLPLTDTDNARYQLALKRLSTLQGGKHVRD